MSSLAYAIANNEGFGTPGASTITALNNPGAIEDGNGNFLSYDSLDDGFAAIDSDVQGILDGTSNTGLNSDSSLADLADVWTNGNPNAADNYASYLGVSPDTTLGELQQNGYLTPGQSGIASTNQPSNTTAAQKTSNGSGLWGLITKFIEGAAGTPKAEEAILTRFAFGLIGLILVFVGLLGFKQTQVILQNAVKGAAIAS